jgi:ornithine cyclodeaminase/alanine dehydrogenase-like protein (mu-crystallin family)
VKWISAETLALLAPYRDIVEALRQGFCSAITTPVRQHHHVPPHSIFLLMPAWSADWTGLKSVMVKPDNAGTTYPTVQATYQLFENQTGTPVVAMDGTELTRRRTAAASALAADYLARPEAETLVVVGAGALAPHFVHAHACVRPIRRVLICNRDAEKSGLLVRQLQQLGVAAEVCGLEDAVRQADIVSCVTSSTVALVKGEWLQPGTHVDLAGAYQPSMRETDSEVVARARVYVDTRDGAAAEAGDLLWAEAEGRFSFADVQGDLFDLASGRVGGRASADEVTLFKSCGTALEDLVTAQMVYLRS